MKVILKKEHELLGDEGQVVDVKEGYARNYLIPNGYATAATSSNMKNYEEIRKQKSRKTEKEKEAARKTASEIDNFSIEISVKTGEDNKVYGSVTSQMIYDRLAEKGFDMVEKRKIMLQEPIKSLGNHSVEVKLQHSITAKLNVKVVSENKPAEEVQPEAGTDESPAPEQAGEEAKEE